MAIFRKSFSCTTTLTLDQCRSHIQKKYPRPKLMSANTIFLENVVKNDGIYSFRLKQSIFRGFFIGMDAIITQNTTGSKVEGSVYVLFTSLMLTIYFCILSLILFFAFRPITFLSLFFLFFSVVMVFLSVGLFRTRNKLVDIVCKALKRECVSL